MRTAIAGVLLTALLVLLPAAHAPAHHSFAAHFESDTIITVEGVVTQFRFSNPHGMVHLTVTDEDGDEAQWRAETNAPVMLRRAGWSTDTLKPGDRITIEGWPGRDGVPLIRIRRVIMDNGEVLPVLGGGSDD